MSGRADAFKAWLDQGMKLGRGVGYDPRCCASVFTDMLPIGRVEVSGEGLWLDDMAARTMAVGLVGAVEVQESIEEARRAQSAAEAAGDESREAEAEYRRILYAVVDKLREVHPKVKVDDEPATAEEMTEAIEAALKIALA